MPKKEEEIMPKALRDFLGLSFFFWSNEQSGGTLEPVHIHICRGKPSSHSTKVWLKPEVYIVVRLLTEKTHYWKVERHS
jgi:hypothetical protein